jgi:predicted N-acyltransferase
MQIVRDEALPGVDRLRVERMSSMLSVSAAEWDRLAAGRTVYSTWSWLRSVERTLPTPPTVLLIRDDRGELLAAAATSTWLSPRGGRYDHVDTLLVPAGVPALERDRWFPALLVGPAAGICSELLVRPDLAEQSRAAAVRILLVAVAAEAERVGARSVTLPFLPPDSADELAEHVDPTHSATFAADLSAVLAVPAGTFTDYTATLSPRYAQGVRRERARFAESGSRLVWTTMAECAEEIVPLAAQVDIRYSGHADQEFLGRLAAIQAEVFGDRIPVVTIRDERDRMLAFGSFLRWENRLYGRQHGMDYQAVRGFEYFVMLYAGIERAQADGLTAIDLGVQSYEAKAQRGALLEQRSTMVIAHKSLGTSWLDLARRHNAATVARWRTRFPGRLGPTPKVLSTKD